MHNSKTPFILFGGDYNPDQWSEEVMERDMELLKKAGVNLVTLPVFSWAKLEPEEGVYRFEWLDAILDRLWENGFHVFLSTPTTAQPAWLSRAYPEVLPVDIAGRKRTHGMRVFFCYNSEKYRERAAAIAGRMAERYRNYPGLAGWHVSNEYGTFCYCDNCQKKFRLWLKERYGTIGNLNDKWYTSFWGRTVYDFDEIMLPTELNDDYRFNPAIQLDYQRFVTDSTLDCYLNEADILKAATPDLPVFSNISGFIKKLDQFKLVSHMDCAGFDNYPRPGDPVSLPALKHDIMRGLKNGESFLVTEQSPNQQNWQPYNKLKRPMELRRIAYQGMAHGSDSCLYFQMRQSAGGQEKFHGAVISHADREDTRIFKELSRIGEELAGLGDVFLEGKIKARVGILFDWDNWWELENISGPTADMDYLSQVHTYYKPFYDRNIPVDILPVTADLSSYRLIVAPLLCMMKDGVDDRLREFVRNGGTLIATYMTGMCDENGRCVYGAYPGPLRDVLGIWVEERDALRPEESNVMILEQKLGREKLYRCGFLCDVVRAESADVLGVYGSDFYKGEPCLTRNSFGRGYAYYLASCPEEAFLEAFMEKTAREAGIGTPYPFEGRLEITVRDNGVHRVVFVINHGDTQGIVDLGEEPHRNLLTGEQTGGGLVVEPGDVAVLERLPSDI